MLKEIISTEKQSHDFCIPLSQMFKDVGVPLSDAVTMNKFKTLNAQTVIALRSKGHDMNIYLASLLEIKKEIRDEMSASKNRPGHVLFFT